MVEQPIEQRGDGGGVAEELAPVFHGAIRRDSTESPATRASSTGARSSTTRSSPPPSSIACSITRPPSTSRATATGCGRRRRPACSGASPRPPANPANSRRWEPRWEPRREPGDPKVGEQGTSYFGVFGTSYFGLDIMAELGVDMTVFPTDKHSASWAELCPGNNESAGKHRSGRARHGNRWLRAALTEAALATSVPSTKGAFAARSRRIMPHRGHKKPSSPWRTPCSSPRTTSWPARPRTRIRGATTMTATRPSALGGAPFRHSNVRASGSPSNPPPEREVNPPWDFLSNTRSQT